MSANQVLVALLAAVIFMGGTEAARSQVQENRVEGLEKRIPGAATLESTLPTAANGTPIAESQVVWAYVAAVVGFLLVFVLAWVCVRILAFLVIVVCFVGGIGFVCSVIYDKTVTTWEQLGLIVLYVGAISGVAAVTANIYLIRGGVEGKD